MTVDTSSNPRSEWYEEYPEPDGQPEVFHWVSSRNIDAQISVQMSVYTKAFLKKVEGTSQQIKQFLNTNFASAVVPKVAPSELSVRERALRHAKQPHSMAQNPNDFHFDNHGRRRY